MPRFALKIEYDGRPFAGWQAQADQPSVQGAIEAALARLDPGFAAGARVAAAGRTGSLAAVGLFFGFLSIELGFFTADYLGNLPLRVRYSLSAPRRDHELEDFKDLTQVLPMGFGDDWLRFNGIGENVTWGLYNNDKPTDAQKDQLAEVLRWAVGRGMTATFHWHNDKAVHHLLDVLEKRIAEVDFDAVGRKKLLVNLAPIEKL